MTKVHLTCHMLRSHAAMLVAVALTVGLDTVEGQWSKQSPLPTRLDVRGIAAPAPAHLFVATDDDPFDNGGSLFESTDGGTSWIQRGIPVTLSEPLNGIFFLDANLGWTFGNANYRTTDGGATWVDLPFLGSTYFMEFYSPSFGLATGNFGQSVSLDGGNTWAPSPNGMHEFAFVDDQNGLGASAAGVYRTTDGGATFAQVATGDAQAVTYLSGTMAVAIVADTFLRSTDGGGAWNTVAGALGRDHMLAVSGSILLAWGRSGAFPDYDDRVLRSTDGGLSWSDLGEIVPEGVLALAAPDGQDVVAAGRAGNMFQSSDAGLTWVQAFASPGSQPGFLSSAVPVFANQSTGYFGYGPGFIMNTTDGGASWAQISSGTGRTLHDLARFPDGHMIAVGDEGTILASNGMTPWIQQPRPSANAMTAVQVID